MRATADLLLAKKSDNNSQAARSTTQLHAKTPQTCGRAAAATFRSTPRVQKGQVAHMPWGVEDGEEALCEVYREKWWKLERAPAKGRAHVSLGQKCVQKTSLRTRHKCVHRACR